MHLILEFEVGVGTTIFLKLPKVIEFTIFYEAHVFSSVLCEKKAQICLSARVGGSHT